MFFGDLPDPDGHYHMLMANVAHCCYEMDLPLVFTALGARITPAQYQLEILDGTIVAIRSTMKMYVYSLCTVPSLRLLIFCSKGITLSTLTTVRSTVHTYSYSTRCKLLATIPLLGVSTPRSDLPQEVQADANAPLRMLALLSILAPTQALLNVLPV